MVVGLQMSMSAAPEEDEAEIMGSMSDGCFPCLTTAGEAGMGDHEIMEACFSAVDRMCTAEDVPIFVSHPLPSKRCLPTVGAPRGTN